jgi:hypothetical protein
MDVIEVCHRDFSQPPGEAGWGSGHRTLPFATLPAARSWRPRQLALNKQLAGELPPWTHRAKGRITQNATAHAIQPIWTPGKTRCDTYTITHMPPGSSGVGSERTLLAHTTRRRPRSANGVPPRLRETTDEP